MLYKELAVDAMKNMKDSLRESLHKRVYTLGFHFYENSRAD